MIIALDVDGVLADCASVVHAEAQRILGCDDLRKPEFWHSFDFADSMDLSEEQWDDVLDQIKLDNALGWQIQLYDGAAKFVFDLTHGGGHEVYFLTAQWEGLSHWTEARTALLRRYFPLFDVVYTHAKHRADFDWLVEDRAQTAAKIGKQRCILLDRPWNRLNRPAGFHVATGYADLLDTIEMIDDHASS